MLCYHGYALPCPALACPAATNMCRWHSTAMLVIAGGGTVKALYIEHAGESKIKGGSQQAPGAGEAKQGTGLADPRPAAVICYREAS